MLLAYLYLALLEPKTPPKQLRRPCRELLPKRSRKEVERSAQRRSEDAQSALRRRAEDAQRRSEAAQRMFRGSSEARSGANSK